MMIYYAVDISAGVIPLAVLKMFDPNAFGELWL